MRIDGHVHGMPVTCGLWEMHGQAIGELDPPGNSSGPSGLSDPSSNANSKEGRGGYGAPHFVFGAIMSPQESSV